MNENSRKIAVIHKGSLEAAGLGEVAYFLRKARQQIDHAKFALEQIDFSRSAEMLGNVGTRVDEIEKIMTDMRNELGWAEQAALGAVEEKEERDAEAEAERKRIEAAAKLETAAKRRVYQK